MLTGKVSFTVVTASNYQRRFVFYSVYLLPNSDDVIAQLSEEYNKTSCVLHTTVHKLYALPVFTKFGEMVAQEPRTKPLLCGPPP